MAIDDLDRLRTRFADQADYSIDLQRIIEALCKGHEIPEPKTAARHHYNMAVAARTRPLGEAIELVERSEDIVGLLRANEDKIYGALARAEASERRMVELTAERDAAIKREALARSFAEIKMASIAAAETQMRAKDGELAMAERRTDALLQLCDEQDLATAARMALAALAPVTTPPAETTGERL